MEKSVETYMGVKISDVVNKDDIVYIFNNHKKESATAIAEKRNLKNRQVVSTVITQLRKANKIEQAEPKPEPKKEIENTQPFGNYEGSNKKVARKIMVNAICSTSSTESNILTLPAERWMIERKILAIKKRSKFTAVERELDVYQNMVKKSCTEETLSGSVLQMTWGDLGDVIKTSSEDQFSHAILDYCGYIDTFHAEIEDLMENNKVRVGGFICLTFAVNNRHMTREGKLSGKLLEFFPNPLKHSKENKMTDSEWTTDMAIKLLISKFEGRYKLDTHFRYKDTQTPMGLYIVRRME